MSRSLLAKLNLPCTGSIDSHGSKSRTDSTPERAISAICESNVALGAAATRYETFTPNNPNGTRRLAACAGVAAAIASSAADARAATSRVRRFTAEA
jgi:hypothetical protein